MRPHERIPIHGHTGQNDGGALRGSVVVSATGGLDTSTGSGGSTSAPVNLDDLADVYVPSPTDQDVVTWDAGSGLWISQAAPGASGGITVEDEGSPLSTTATTLDFVGAGVTASGSGATKTITIPGGGMSNPMTTAGDLIVGGVSGAPARLAKGSDSQVLTVDPVTHLVAWANPASGFANPMTTKGDLIIGDTGGSAIRKAVGTDGHVLTADAASTGGVKWAAAAGGAPDPVTDKFGAPSTAYEFSSSSLTGLTTFGSPDVVDANTTVPGHLFLKDTSSTWQFCGVYASASAPFTAIARLSESFLAAQYNYAGLFVGAATPGKMVHASVRYDNGGGYRGFGGYVSTSPTDSSGTGVSWSEPTMQQINGPVYIAIVVNSSTDVRVWYSFNGYIWVNTKPSFDPGSVTIGSVGLEIAAGSTGSSRITLAAFDYLRIWNSALTMPG